MGEIKHAVDLVDSFPKYVVTLILDILGCFGIDHKNAIVLSTVGGNMHYVMSYCRLILV